MSLSALQWQRQLPSRGVPTLNHHLGIIVPLPSLLSCFVALSGPPSAASLWQQQQRHFCRVLQLQKLQQVHEKTLSCINSSEGELGTSAQSLAEAADAAGAPQVYVGWIGAGLSSADATAVREASAAAAGEAAQIGEVVLVGISGYLSSLLSLEKGERVVVSSVDVGALEKQQKSLKRNWPHSTNLEVAPLGRVDWDAVQLHAEALEEQVLEQVALLMPHQTFPLWIGGGSKPALLRVCTPQDVVGDDECAPPFFLLSQNTELHVRPLAQAAFRRNRSRATSSTESSGAVAGDGEEKADLLRVLPLLDEIKADVVRGKGIKDISQCCECGRSTAGEQGEDAFSWQYFCYVHPAHLTVLQHHQQWLRPALRSGLPRSKTPGASTAFTDALLETLRDQRVAAAEEVALISVRRAYAYAGASGGWKRDRSHAFVVAIAAADAPLGCVRMPAFIRRLYGWAISSKVAVEPWKRLPTLPCSLLLTPIVSTCPFSRQEQVDFEKEDKKSGVDSPASSSVPGLVAQFLETDEGRNKLLESFLSLTNERMMGHQGRPAAVSSMHSRNCLPVEEQSAREAAHDLRPSLVRAVWDGAILRVPLHVRLKELHTVQQRRRLLTAEPQIEQSQEPYVHSSKVAAGGTREGRREQNFENQSHSSRSERAERGGGGKPLGSELQELAAGLQDLYVSSDAEASDSGDVGYPQSSIDTCLKGTTVPKTPSHIAADRHALQKTLAEWANLEAKCSIVEEASPNLARGLMSGITGERFDEVNCLQTSQAIHDHSIPRKPGRGTPVSSIGISALTDELLVPVDIIISFADAGGVETTKSVDRLQTPLRQQPSPSPQFGSNLPPAFASLHRLQPPSALESDRPTTCVLLDASFRSLVRQDEVAVRVTQPLPVVICQGDCREETTELCLPLRFANSGYWSETPSSLHNERERPVLSETMGDKGTAADEGGGNGTQLVIKAKALETAQRLWWLVPYSLMSRHAPAAASSLSTNIKALGTEAQLLQLLQQGCVEVPLAEVASGLCRCKESLSPSPIIRLLDIGCAKRPLLGDFNDLRAFGESPAAVSDAVYRRLGALHNLHSSGPSFQPEQNENFSSAIPDNPHNSFEMEKRACQAFQTLDVCSLLICGPRGSGRSALCRAVCIDARRKLGIFTITVHCRLLAREAMSSLVVQQALASAFDSAQAHGPSIVLLEDLDVLCFSGEDSNDRPSVAGVRSTAIATFLCELMRRAPGGSTADRAERQGLCAARGVLTIATAVSISALHPILCQPLAFGSSKLHIRCDTSLVIARLELLRTLLELIVDESRPQHSSKLFLNSPSCGWSSVLLDDRLLKEGCLWDIASRLEGYCLADLQAVVARAVGESMLDLPIEVAGKLDAFGCSTKVSGSGQVVLRPLHLLKALDDVLPRATQQKSFIQPYLRYCHVGGLQKPKDDLHDLLTMQRAYPLLLRHSGISMHQGLLLVGPPGCGKTHLALAAVGEAGIRCIHVKGPELLGKFIGSSEAAVRDVFHRAQAAKPCAVLFDEIEALAIKRGGDTTGVTDRVVNQLLCYLDGIEAREVCQCAHFVADKQTYRLRNRDLDWHQKALSDVFVIATTSRPDLVDAALMRPGRLEKVCFCGLPATDAERTEILSVCLKSLSTDFAFDVQTMGRNIPSTFSPADIQAAVNQSQLQALQESLSGSAEDNRDPETLIVAERHFLAAIRCARPSLSVPEVLRYHRFCLPYLSEAYRERVRAIECQITASGERAPRDQNEYPAHPTSCCGTFPKYHPVLGPAQRFQGPHAAEEEIMLKAGESSSLHEDALREFETGPESFHSLQKRAASLSECDDWTRSSKVVRDAQSKDSLACAMESETECECVGASNGRHRTDKRRKQILQRRRREILSQMAGSRVALA